MHMHPGVHLLVMQLLHQALYGVLKEYPLLAMSLYTANSTSISFRDCWSFQTHSNLMPSLTWEVVWVDLSWPVPCCTLAGEMTAFGCTEVRTAVRAQQFLMLVGGAIVKASSSLPPYTPLPSKHGRCISSSSRALLEIALRVSCEISSSFSMHACITLEASKRADYVLGRTPTAESVPFVMRGELF
eukprot:6172058-Pleurochrysis_carterae.AAC.2